MDLDLQVINSVTFLGTILCPLSSSNNFHRLPGSSVGKESVCNAEDVGFIPGSGRFLGEKHGNPLQYSCLENPMDRGS